MKELLAKFRQRHPGEEIRLVKSPLRICPLGAHVDHQHGLVTGMALQASVNLAYCPNPDGYIRIQSLDFPDEEYFHLDNVPGMIPGYWGNYVRGAVMALSRKFKLQRGFNAVISGRLPIGGLSSSAAVTTAYLMALCDVNELNVSKEELIQHSHWVENGFIGLKNGILDQSANILSLDKHLMYMDCLTGKYEMIRRSEQMPEFEVAVVYSGLSTALISTDYNNRVDECKVSAWLLQEIAHGSISAFKDVRLRDVDYGTYDKYIDWIPGRFRKRAEHFFSENERVKKGVEYWGQGDLKSFGQLMFESGRSSIAKYECGCPELITIFNLLSECPGVYGARFSGAGYRGCCIGLIDPQYKDRISQVIHEGYPSAHPMFKDQYRVYFCATDDGARLVALDQTENSVEVS
ncbi:MAG: galactokinase family protein [Negativicutes bacterium]|nr:galactokinase family protein [Negativicutes bacterium]